MKFFDEFHKSIGNPDILALSLELDSCDWLRIMVAIKGRVLALNLWGMNQDDPELDWSDNSEVQQYLMFKNKDFKDLTKEEKRILKWGWFDNREIEDLMETEEKRSYKYFCFKHGDAKTYTRS